MNKKECRKYAEPGLTFSPGNGLLHVKKVKHIVRAAIRNIAGRRVLALYFYNREITVKGVAEPEYTLFQCRDDYITLDRSDPFKEKWREASLENIGTGNSRFADTSAFYRKHDEQLVTRFCHIPDKTGLDALTSLQAVIMGNRLTDRIMKREKKTIERMKPVAAEPRGLNGWIRRDALPHYIFYDYARGKLMKGYCTACRHDVMVSGAKYNLKGKCPNCKKSITFKASGKAKRVWDRVTVQTLQRVNGNELVLRIFKVYNSLRNWRDPDLTVHENARVFIWLGTDGKVSVEPYYFSYNKGYTTHWVNGERPRLAHYQYSFECDLCGHLYCGNLDKTLADSPWQYSQIGRFYQIEPEPMEVVPYLSAYHRFPALEYLVKLGLTRLTAQIVYEHSGGNIVNPNGKDLRETLGIESADLPILQKINANVRQLELYQALKPQSVKIDETLLAWYKDCGIATKEDMMTPLKYTKPNKLMRYINEQFERLKEQKSHYGGWRYEKPNRVLSEYKDYLEMGAQLDYDFTDDFVLFPKNLPGAHDQANKLYDNRKQSIFNKAIREAYKTLSERYRFTKGGFTLIPPKTANEIVKEGHTLHHCVNSYVERVAQGKCMVLFIRNTDNIKEPFYTIEVRDGRVIQIHGKYHCAPTPEVQNFLKLWEHKKLKTANDPIAA